MNYFINFIRKCLVWTNTAKDGTGTDLQPIVDADGHSQTDVVAALPAGTNLIGQVYGYDNTNAIYSGTTSRTPAFAIIDAATSGDNTIKTAGTNKIRVLALYLVAAGTVNVRFESGTGGTALSGQMNLIANTGFVLPYNPLGWFETASATLLNMELSAAISVDGGFVYIDTT